MIKQRRLIALLFLSLLFINCISALRITPAITQMNFKPGMETEITYTVDNTLNRELEIFAEGTLAQYVTLTPNRLFETGNFIATFKLPETIEPPGPQRTYIGIREVVDEEKVVGVATAVTIRASVLIHVPYPGKYLETGLSAHNVNIGEPVTFILNIASRGSEDLIMKPRIEIYSEEDEIIETLEFQEREIKSGEIIELKNVLETYNYGSGNYYAVSKIDYSDRTAEARADFKVGDLVVNIVNYSKQITIDGIQRFWIEIESGWNNRIDGAFADVVIYDKTNKEMSSFRTDPTDLEPWQSNDIGGFFDTTPFVPGIYNANVSVTYYGRDRGQSTSQMVQVEFVKKPMPKWIFISLVSGGVIFGAVILFIIFRLIKSSKNGKKGK